MATTRKVTTNKSTNTEHKDGAKITWRNNKDGSLLALFNVTFSGITIYGCKLFISKDGEKNFVSMPQEKSGDNYYNVVYVNNDIMSMICDWACKAYEADNGIYEHQPLTPAK